MHSHLGKILALTLLGLAGGANLQAQTAADLLSAASEAYYNKMLDSMLSYLTPMQRAEFEKALYPALDKNPELVQQGVDLLAEGGKKVEENTPADREAYFQKMQDYEGRLRGAMLTEDPDVGKIFDEIEAHLKFPSPASTPAAPAPQ